MRVIRLLPICLVCLLLTSCGSSPQDLIIGRWENTDERDKYTVEFNRDGTLSVTKGPLMLKGRYEFIDRGMIDVEIENPLANAAAAMGPLKFDLPKTASQRRQITVTKEELVTTEPDGKVTKFKRVK